MKWIYDCSYRELKSDFDALGLNPFVVDQVFFWLYRKNVQEIEGWTNIGKKVREELGEWVDTRLNRIEKVEKDRRGTQKFLFRLNDSREIESVLIREKDHTTLCISSQVGCALGCTFCATGKMGFKRNLSAGEILSQVLCLKKETAGYGGKANLVFMGMGEPLLNYENLKKALQIIVSPQGLAVSPRNITVSTAGIPERIEDLERDFPRVKLSFSLNAPDQDTRERLMPVAGKAHLNKILAYFRRSRRKHRVTFEYVMLKGVNDSLADAGKLARLLKGIGCKINLIPYNGIKGAPFHSPPKKDIEEFCEYLGARGYTVMVRWSKGGDIQSACGQLATE